MPRNKKTSLLFPRGGEAYSRVDYWLLIVLIDRSCFFFCGARTYSTRRTVLFNLYLRRPTWLIVLYEQFNDD